ncbi:short chain dehydrogenase family protein [Collimonas fungivorans]|uniref:Short chain dehydrogenase family protein n=1 Tax=Collimonas fungivorans TaxID=158899 RepID=A0A127PG11_9BURK|nr:SDR family oxidoreductase [Collimonas fungivorans]AMO96574.1 short chain dehydrogenase family protein [Collimonas fungivorans]
MKKIAIVTGASQGIGRATAIRLARDFAGVVVVARNAAKLADTAKEVEKAGAQALIIDIDLSQLEAADTVVSKTLERFGRIDALLNIAGDVPQIDLFQMTDEQWDAGMSLKFHGARRLTIRAWEALKAAQGSVVITSGNSAAAPKAAFAAVAAINAAIVSLAKAFSERGIHDGVQVNSVLPGPVMTGRRETFLSKWSVANGMSVEEAKSRFLEAAGISRYGQPEEIGELMAFLLSPAAKWMTGSAIRMDGGEIKAM